MNNVLIGMCLVLCGGWFFFSVRLLSVLLGHSFFSSPLHRPMTSDFEGFSIPDCIHYIYFPILILEKEAVFPFRMFSAKQESYSGTIFITPLVWRSPWLGIEPRTSRTLPLSCRGGGNVWPWIVLIVLQIIFPILNQYTTKGVHIS